MENLVISKHAEDRWLQRVTVKHGLPRESILKALSQSQRISDRHNASRYFHRLTRTVFVIANNKTKPVLVTVAPATKHTFAEADKLSKKPKLTPLQIRSGYRLCAVCEQLFMPNYPMRPHGLKACIGCIPELKERQRLAREEKKRSLAS